MILEKILKVSGVANYPERTALFITSIITRLWEDRTIAVTLKIGLKHEQIRDCLRHIKPKHIETAFQELEKCKINKKIYFAKALISAITESGIEEIFEEGGDNIADTSQGLDRE